MWPVAANRSRRRATFSIQNDRNRILYMKAKSAKPVSDEPIGIVISRGSQPEKQPVLFAYVWAAAPEDDTSESKVA